MKSQTVYFAVYGNTVEGKRVETVGSSLQDVKNEVKGLLQSDAKEGFMASKYEGYTLAKGTVDKNNKVTYCEAIFGSVDYEDEVDEINESFEK